MVCNMTTKIITHKDCLKHINPPGHPEKVERLEYILDALTPLGFDIIAAPLVADDDLLRVHSQSHISAIQASVPKSGWTSLDNDTHVCPDTLTAALRSAGGAIRAVDMVMADEVQSVFVATRPPGHHCERETPMGFCFFGNVALAAKHALDHHGLSRVAIVDFDVHHGNGTQDLVEGDARILFASTHQMPLYPGTGHAHETGGYGNVVNVPLIEGAGTDAFRAAMMEKILPAVDTWAPELLLISAGFDAHKADPLAGMELDETDFAWVTKELCLLAKKHSNGRVVSCLEGGYDVDALASSVVSHVKALKG
jgi:acetoin utilization deacetylase AcuC-like enzyme